MDAEERALLAAIIAYPDEDTPRLVYADWLDEHADVLPAARRESARARAELIRLQIERAALIFGAKGFEERDWALGDRIVELEQDYTRTWVNELPAATRGRGLRFELDRWMFGAVGCTVNYFVRSGRALMDAAPVTAVRLKGLTIRNLAKLAKCPHFPRLHALQAYANYTTHETLLALLNRPEAPLLRGLFLNSAVIDMTNEEWHTRCDGIAQVVPRRPGSPAYDTWISTVPAWAAQVAKLSPTHRTSRG
jgi:uncharacterized protein (TIGR02996 family)